MGVQLGEIVHAKTIAIEDLASRSIAFDGNNILYQFLSIIRGSDGQPLKDREGRVTSHLSGLIYRNSNLVEAGIKIVYVFDGNPHMFKRQVLEQRHEVRVKAKVQYEKAVKEGNKEKARRYGQQAVVATTNIVEDAKTLLTHLGIPWIQAPGEGEAQTAYMAIKGEVWGAASQDYDSLLFGAPKHLRNLSITGRRKLPRKNVYIKIEPEILELNNVINDLGISKEQLIDIGILIGTDYNPNGIKGIGPKTALKLIKQYGNLEKTLPHIKNVEFPYPPEEIKELFLNPITTDDYELDWRKPDIAATMSFLCGEHNFNQRRVMNALDKISKGYKKMGQLTTLDRFFV